MKECPKCKITKSSDDFAKNASRKDGLQRICRNCVKNQDAILFKKNKDNIVKRNKKYVNKVTDWFSSYKETLSCKICGDNRFWVLEFHHLDPTQKDFNIGEKWKQGYSINRIQNEIKKCICVCANCHKDIHYKEKHNTQVGAL